MPSVDDQLQTGSTDFNAAAAAGVNTLDLNYELVFDLYDRVVLPLDGYVFWVKRTPTVGATTQLTVKGSLHIATVNTQDAGANISQSRVTFTSLAEVNDLRAIAPTTAWICTHPDTGLKIAFSIQGNYFKVANLYHYVGYALYADLATQVIDDPATLPSALIISNSLPIWLYLSQYAPSAPAYGFANPFRLYPAFLVPDDISPVSPYGAVDILDDRGEAIQNAPLIKSDQSHYQLVMDRVRVTLYGATNKQALDFVDCINQYSLDYDTIGIMNQPVIRDAKRTQNEFSILGMKKTIEYDVSYYQSNVAAVARQLIKKAVPSYIFR